MIKMVLKGSVTAIRATPEETAMLNRAWTRSGEYMNRTAWMKAAINAFANQQIFPVEE